MVHEQELRDASRNGNLAKVKEILAKGDNINVNEMDASGWCPLSYATYFKHIDLVKFYLSDPRFDVNPTHTGSFLTTPVYLTCQIGDTDLMKIFLDDPRTAWKQARDYGETPISILKQNGFKEQLEVMRRFREKNMNFEEEIVTIVGKLKRREDVYQSLCNLRDLLDEPVSRKKTIDGGGIEALLETFKTCSNEDKGITLRILYHLSLNEEIVNQIVKIDGFKTIAEVFIQSDLDAQDKIVVTWRYMNGRSKIARHNLASYQDLKFVRSLRNYVEKSPHIQLRQNAAGVLMYFAGLIKPEDQDAVKYAVNEVIFPAIKNDGTAEVERIIALDCCMIASSIDTSRPILLEMGIKELVQKFVNTPDSDMGFVGCFIQALLSASDTNDSNVTGSNPTSPVVITRMLEALNTFATTTKLAIHTMKGYQADCPMIAKAIGSLATNEANLKDLYSKGVVDKFITLLKNRREDLLNQSMETTEQVARAIWVLAFDDTCKQAFIAAGAVDLLKAINIGNNQGAKQAIDGALWTFGSTEKRKRPVVQQPTGGSQQSSGAEDGGHIMISYCWAQKERARDFANYLKSLGLNIWIDVEQMEGSVLEAMADAVENASTVLIFLSSQYKESQACRTEAEYTYKLKKDVLCIMAEDGYQPRGWLGALLGNKLWFNPWNPNSTFEANTAEILKQLKKSSQAQNLGTPQKPQQVSNYTPTYSPNSNAGPQMLELTAQLDNILKKLDSMEGNFNSKLQSLQTQINSLEEKLIGKEDDKKKKFFSR